MFVCIMSVACDQAVARKSFKLDFINIMVVMKVSPDRNVKKSLVRVCNNEHVFCVLIFALAAWMIEEMNKLAIQQFARLFVSK